MMCDRSAATIKTIYFTFFFAIEVAVGWIALLQGVVFNVFPHETDVSARAIKEF